MAADRSEPTRYGHRSLILAICCMSLFVVSLDATIVNVALPSIAKDLDSDVKGLQWVLDAYALTIASLLVLSGSSGDRLGRRRVFQVGLVVFGVGSLACSLAPTVGFLIAARVLQAVGGSMMNPVALSIITSTFTDAKERARAVGVWGAVVGLSFGLGPFVGGVLVQTVGWRSIFWVNVPVVIAAILLTAAFVPESRGGTGKPPDPVGQALVIVLLGGTVFGLIEGPGLGWGSPGTIGVFAAAAASLAAFVAWARRTDHPLIDVRFFKAAPFTSAVLTALIAFASWGAFLFVITLYLQDSRGLSPIQAGLCTMPAGAAILVLSPLSGRLTSAIGTRLPLTLAALAMGTAAALLAAVTASTPIPLVVGCIVLLGAGFAMVNAPITNTAVSGMPTSQAGSAAAVASTARQVGQALGVAVAGSITGASGSSRLGADFAQATHPLWWTLVGVAVVMLVLANVSNTHWAQRSAKRVAPLLGD